MLVGIVVIVLSENLMKKLDDHKLKQDKPKVITNRLLVHLVLMSDIAAITEVALRYAFKIFNSQVLKHLNKCTK